MDKKIYVHQREAVLHAAELMEEFGMGAKDQAYSRAEQARNLGNIIHFCRWRQIERLIEYLENDAVIDTIH